MMGSDKSTPWGLLPTNGKATMPDMGATNQFSERLDLALADNGLTNADFARALGPTGQQTVNKWRERGRVGMKSEKRVAELLPSTNMTWLQHATGDRLRPVSRPAPRVYEPPPNHDPHQSLAARLDRVILADALKVLSIDEKVGGSYGLQRRADVLVELYDRLAAGADPMVLMARVTKARSPGGKDGQKDGNRSGGLN